MSGSSLQTTSGGSLQMSGDSLQTFGGVMQTMVGDIMEMPCAGMPEPQVQWVQVHPMPFVVITFWVQRVHKRLKTNRFKSFHTNSSDVTEEEGSLRHIWCLESVHAHATIYDFQDMLNPLARASVEFLFHF
jgi:hypothetical protein